MMLKQSINYANSSIWLNVLLWKQLQKVQTARLFQGCFQVPESRLGWKYQQPSREEQGGAGTDSPIHKHRCRKVRYRLTFWLFPFCSCQAQFFPDYSSRLLHVSDFAEQWEQVRQWRISRSLSRALEHHPGKTGPRDRATGQDPCPQLAPAARAGTAAPAAFHWRRR